MHSSPQPRPGDSARYLPVALAATCFLISAAFGLSLRDGLLQFDDLTHYLFARWAWTWPSYLLDDWGRPGFTTLYFLPAGLGWTACRTLSAFLSAISALLACRIAERMGIRNTWAVIPLVFAQPLFFQLSQTTLTETAMAFYLTLAVYLAQRSRWSASSAILSLAFVTRHEAIIFLPVWLYFARRDRVPLRRLWPILWAPFLVNLLAPLASIRPSIVLFFDPTREGQYGRGGWLTYFCRALEAWGPGITVLAMTGLVAILRPRRQEHAEGHQPATGLVAACIIVYFTAQTVVRALGLYDSGGYARFLVPISPLVGIAALAGWHRLTTRDAVVRQLALMTVAGSMLILWLATERQLVLHAAQLDEAAAVPDLRLAKMAVRISTVFIVTLALGALWSARTDRHGSVARYIVPAALVVTILLAVLALCYPLRPPPEAPLVADAKVRLTAMGLGDRDLLSAVVWIDYVFDRKFPPQRPTVRAQLEQAPLGILFAWEMQFAASLDHGLALEEFTDSPAFRLVLETPPLPGRSSPYLRIFEKIAHWP